MNKRFAVVGQGARTQPPSAEATPDEATPDEATPDEATPDEATPGQAVDAPEARAEGPTLAELRALSAGALLALYRRLEPPGSVALLDGDWSGHILSGHGLLGAPAPDRLLRWVGRTRQVMRWSGKTFRAASEREGAGHNRVRLGGERTVARFATRMGASLMDGRGCVLLDYDLPGGSLLIRPMRDELRRVGDDLLIGPAMWRVQGDLRPIAWFALARQHRGVSS